MLFTEDAIFMFHSRSKDAPPGRGVGEALSLPVETFAVLATIPDWRRVLSNFAVSRFTLDGLTWTSVEHYFQAAKFKVVAPEYYRGFAIESGTPLSVAMGPEVKRAGGRTGYPLAADDLARWESMKAEVMHRALAAKYAQHELSRRVLLATDHAKLTHRPLRAAHTRVEVELMAVRQAVRDTSRLGPNVSTPR